VVCSRYRIYRVSIPLVGHQVRKYGGQFVVAVEMLDETPADEDRAVRYPVALVVVRFINVQFPLQPFGRGNFHKWHESTLCAVVIRPLAHPGNTAHDLLRNRRVVGSVGDLQWRRLRDRWHRKIESIEIVTGHAPVMGSLNPKTRA